MHDVDDDDDEDCRTDFVLAAAAVEGCYDPGYCDIHRNESTMCNSALSLPPSRQILMGAAIVWQHCAIACCCMSAMLELLHGRVFQSPCNEVKRMLLLGQVTARTRQKLWLYS